MEVGSYPYFDNLKTVFVCKSAFTTRVRGTVNVQHLVPFAGQTPTQVNLKRVSREVVNKNAELGLAQLPLPSAPFRLRVVSHPTAQHQRDLGNDVS
jgi:hypothetical protein